MKNLRNKTEVVIQSTKDFLYIIKWENDVFMQDDIVVPSCIDVEIKNIGNYYLVKIGKEGSNMYVCLRADKVTDYRGL